MKRCLLLMITLFLAALACGGPTLTPTPEPLVKTPAATARPLETPMPTPAPLEQSVTFKVQVPPETPAGGTIYLVLLPFYDWAESQRIAMSRNEDGTWSASVAVPQGGLIRYVYDRGWEPPASSKATRERFDETLAVEFRFLYVSPDVTEVQDIVARWNDILAETSTGTIRGTVKNAATGEPIWEATVSVAGVHAGTYHDGYFEIDGVPAGAQRITAFADDGRFRTQSHEVVVTAGESTEANFEVEPARQVTVTFQVQVPEDTPEWAAPRITGSIPQLGSATWTLNALFPSPLRTAPMSPTGPGQFETEIVGYEGLFIQYAYTLGSLGVGTDVNPDGTFRLRSILVPGEPMTVTDSVMWRVPGNITVEFHVRVPPNTPQGVPVLLNYGPLTVMHQIGPLEWGLPYYHPPGDGQYALPYGYGLGTVLAGEVTQPDKVEPSRTLVVPSQDTQISDTVERWRWTLPSTAGPPFAVDFYVAVPPEMPAADKVYLSGDAPELGDGDPSRAIEMTRETESLWHVNVSFDSAGTVKYRFLRGAARIDDGQEHSVEVSYSGQQVLAWVIRWQDQEPSPISPRATFMAGAAIPDVWGDEFIPLLPSTLDRLKTYGVEWVDVPQIWSYGQLEPVPILEDRSLRVGPLLTSLGDMQFIAREVKSRGMKLLIHAQAAAETSLAEQLSGPRSDEWYKAFLPQFERFMLDVAAMAQEVGADMVAIPRLGPFSFESPTDEAAFNAGIEEIIMKMRTIYGGYLTSEDGVGAPLRYGFHRLLDYQGVYWFEPLEVTDDAPVEEMQAAIEARLDGPYRDAYLRYGKPVVIMQFAYGSYSGAARLGPVGDPGGTEDMSATLDLMTQARLYEAFFRAVASRPWVAGMFPFGYNMLDLPVERGFSMRAKPAEAVTARWYELLSP